MSVGQGSVGSVLVHTTDYRGYTPEELADRALDRIIHVGDSSHPAIIEQAKAFRSQIRAVLVHYLREAQSSERTTICGELIKHGQADLAEIIRRM